MMERMSNGYIIFFIWSDLIWFDLVHRDIKNQRMLSSKVDKENDTFIVLCLFDCGVSNADIVVIIH